MGPTRELSTGVRLRVFERDDVTTLYNAIQKNKTHLSEWQAWYEVLKTKREVQAFIDENKRQLGLMFDQAEMRTGHPGFQCGLFSPQNEVIGMVGYQGFNLRNKVAALGYWIDEDWQGKGLVTESVKCLIEYGWDVFHIHRYEIQAWVGNEKSAKVAQRLGFVKEGILKEIEKRGEGFVDHYLFRLVPSDL